MTRREREGVGEAERRRLERLGELHRGIGAKRRAERGEDHRDRLAHRPRADLPGGASAAAAAASTSRSGARRKSGREVPPPRRASTHGAATAAGSWAKVIPMP